MPLDTGAVTQTLLMSAGVDMNDTLDGGDPTIDGYLNIGAALRATRQRLGRSLQDLSDATRIRRAYLEAIEEMRLDELPSRPFTIGYVRSYAGALGLDGEAAVQRFKQDAPGDIEPLRPPVGVRKHADARISILAGGGAVVVSAVLLWNLAQHAMADDAPPPPSVPEVISSAPQADHGPAVVKLAASQPAPQESTLPQPYVTPGMIEAEGVGGPADAEAANPPASAGATVTVASAAPAPVFTPKGLVHGAPATASVVTLQARKSASLVVRGADGSVHFAMQLKAGEAYRAPMAKGLTIDVSDPLAFDVYVGGRLGKGLSAPVTALSQLQSASAGA